jgi:hypothetical protein
MYSEVVHDQYGLTSQLMSELLHELKEDLLIIRPFDRLHIDGTKLFTHCSN